MMSAVLHWLVVLSCPLLSIMRYFSHGHKYMWIGFRSVVLMIAILSAIAQLLCCGAFDAVVLFSSNFFFFFNSTATTDIYTLSLHDALPICKRPGKIITTS